ncbi:4543_t:CDS:1, partial [Acaulospora colombiana]
TSNSFRASRFEVSKYRLGEPAPTTPLPNFQILLDSQCRSSKCISSTRNTTPTRVLYARRATTRLPESGDKGSKSFHG